MRAILFFVLALAFVPSAEAQSIVGRASVVDGDTLDIRGARIRLHGIDAPESSQFCRAANGSPYRCGQRAAFYLSDLVGSAPVECRQRDMDRFGRVVAECFSGGRSVNAALVRAGWALPYLQYGGRAYVRDEQAARSGKQGMWQGQFDAPWDFRAAQRGGRSRSSGSDNQTRATPVGSYFHDCASMRAGGMAPAHQGDAHYRPELDRDRDGVACE